MSDKKKLIFVPSNETSVKMLAMLGVEFEIRNVEINADLRKKETPVQYIDRIAKEKTDSVWQEGTNVLGVHTAVFVGRRLIKTAENEEDARSILNLYSGRNHVVYTTACLKKADGGTSKRRTFTRIKTRNMDSRAIEELLSSNEWRNQIYCYDPLGIMQKHIIKITGSHTGMMGLPCYEVANLIYHF